MLDHGGCRPCTGPGTLEDSGNVAWLSAHTALAMQDHGSHVSGCPGTMEDTGHAVWCPAHVALSPEAYGGRNSTNSPGFGVLQSSSHNAVFTAEVFNLSQHIADTHFSDHLYWCEQCDVQFSSSSELYLHFQEHSCDEQYLCQFCEHETNDPEDLHSHVVNEHACKLIELSDKYNNGEHGQYSLLSKITFDKCKNFFVCQVCGFRSRLHTNVNRHVAIEHTKIFPHVCDDCGKGFSSMLEYCKHLNSHLSEGIYLCQYCEYSTGQIEDLKIHLDFKHSADLPHKCSDCLMRFGNERELISHLPVHE
ncbi:zinc finger protein 639-like, partial [Marmota marmota marmota]|uniref:zinc finger protein 639-like n=1 Tax=Marmota marmota marmota TaxID=9994 RepID=UPI00076286E5